MKAARGSREGKETNNKLTELQKQSVTVNNTFYLTDGLLESFASAAAHLFNRIKTLRSSPVIVTVVPPFKLPLGGSTDEISAALVTELATEALNFIEPVKMKKINHH